MNKKHVLGLLGLVFLMSWFIYEKSHAPINVTSNNEQSLPVLPTVIPISHASFVLNWDGTVIYNDPVGEASLYAGLPAPDLILLSDVHGDHLSTSTLTALLGSGVRLIAPLAVYELLPLSLKAETEILANDGVTNFGPLNITALPMYNYPETEDSRHAKGRGNGYLLEGSGVRVYIAGDTSGIPEMRSLTDIDMAFIPMNLPYTMSVEEAAEAVAAFSPKQVYPYHYRTPEGFSDVNKFKELVTASNSAIEVVLLPWYPQS